VRADNYFIGFDRRLVLISEAQAPKSEEGICFDDAQTTRKRRANDAQTTRKRRSTSSELTAQDDRSAVKPQIAEDAAFDGQARTR
jgi:hypothetical protein